MKKSILYILCLFSPTLTIAQDLEPEVSEVQISEIVTPGQNVSFDLPESFKYDVDKLLNDWYAKNYIFFDKDCERNAINPTFTDQEYIDRLSRIPAIVELPFNEPVRRMIEAYSGRARNQVSYMLGAANFYFPLFEEALEQAKLPQELKYMAIIESALKPTALSTAGAAGLWQFMPGTGTQYGLELNSLVDERLAPIKSTKAAAQYLKDLYAIYGDWHLVIAAYNCGPGTVNKAIRRSGGAHDYWAIYPYLPKETRGYVPAFIAAAYIMTYYNDHHICPMQTSKIDMDTDTLMVGKQLHFEQISDVLGISLDQIRALNPQYRRDIIPGNNKPSTLRLPRNYVSTFIDSQDTIYTHRQSELLTNRKTVEIKELPVTRSRKGITKKAKGATYVVRKGDSLSTVAAKNKTTVAQLKKLNGIKGTTVKSGQRLRVR